MRLNGRDQIAGSSVMQEEHALTQSPERCGTKLIGTRGTLRDAIAESLAHVMHEKVRVQVDLLPRQRRARAARRAGRDARRDA